MDSFAASFFLMLLAASPQCIPVHFWHERTWCSAASRWGQADLWRQSGFGGDVFFLWADGECKDKSEVRETGSVSCGRVTTSRAASLLKSTKYIFCYIISVFVFPLIWISLAGHHCKSQRWAAAKLMLINEIVVIQESWECIRCFLSVSWPWRVSGELTSIMSSSMKEEGFAASSFYS